MTQSKSTNASTLEMVEFRSKEGVSDSEMLEKSSRLHKALNGMDGFIERYLTHGEDGIWVDLVYWSDLASARTAANAVMNIPVAQEFFALIDEQTMRFIHLQICSKFTQRSN